MSMSKRISYVVSGKVQGVFFRDFTEKQASKLGLTGWVKNDYSGTVSGEAQGKNSALDQFVQSLHQGSPASRVADVKHKEIPIKNGETGFER